AVSDPAVRQTFGLRLDGGWPRTYPARLLHVLGAAADWAALRPAPLAAQPADRRRLRVPGAGDRPQPAVRRGVLVRAADPAAAGRGTAAAVEGRRRAGV